MGRFWASLVDIFVPVEEVVLVEALEGPGFAIVAFEEVVVNFFPPEAAETALSFDSCTSWSAILSTWPKSQRGSREITTTKFCEQNK